MKKQFVLGGVAAALITAMSAGSAFALSNSDLVGERADNAAPTRTIRIDNNARYINVAYGEVVKFEKDGKSFEWQFDGLEDHMKLSQIAPGDVASDAEIYVDQSANPMRAYSGGDN